MQKKRLSARLFQPCSCIDLSFSSPPAEGGFFLPDRNASCQIFHPFLQMEKSFSALIFTHVSGRMNDVRLQYGKTGKFQYPMCDRLENGADVSIFPGRHIHTLRTAGGERKHGLFSFEESICIKAAAFVGSPHGKNSVNIAFEHRRKRKPPERELPDHQVTPLDFTDLLFDLRRESVMFCGMEFFQLLPEYRRIFYTPVGISSRYRIKISCT